MYCSFLPDIPINRKYVSQQLQYWIEGRFPSGNQWINHSSADKATISDSKDDTDKDIYDNSEKRNQVRYQNILQILSTPLARRLGGVEDWE